MSTPGQAARDAFGELGADWFPGVPWDRLHEDLRMQWEAAAQAAIEAGPNAPRRLAAGNTKLREERDQAIGVTENLRGQLGDLREQLAVLHGGMLNLAGNLEHSAAATEPSRKSDIERQAARRIRDLVQAGYESTEREGQEAGK